MRLRSGRLPAVALLLALAVSLAGARVVGAEEPSPLLAEPADDEAAPASTALLRAFGDIDWLSRRVDDPNTFVVGQLDLFATAELTSDVSVLAEVVLEAVDNDERQIADVERFQIRYAPSDLIGVSFGRMHTVLGYWNQTYHHGAWLYTTAFRPEVYRWEDDGGGILPVHEVGLRASGAVSTRPLRVEYSLGLVNGRGSHPEDVVTVQDLNSSKAVSGWLGIAPRAWPGLEVGGLALFDTIPPAPDVIGRESALKERILGAFVVLRRSGVELLSEGFEIRHEDETTGARYRTTGLYAQGAFAAGPVKPYYRFDLIERDEADPYWGESVGDLKKHTVGIRFDPWNRVAVKAEVSHSQPRVGDSVTAAAAQVAFTF